VTVELVLHPDRLLPPDPAVRAIARRLYDAVRTLPILAPHGHVDPGLLVENLPFADPASLLIAPDHYVTRLLHAAGVSLGELGVGAGPLTEKQARGAWRALCAHWPVYRGTAVRYWLEAQLVEIFGIAVRPSPDSADEIFDAIAGQLTRPDFRPRALFDRFGIEVLATTDDPADSLWAHDALAGDPTWTARIMPTFRPDRYLEVGAPGWGRHADRLAEVAEIDTGDYDGYLAALEKRRRYFVAHGATSADHSHIDAGTEPLEPARAQRSYRAAREGTIGAEEAAAFRRHMVFEMARMSCDDGLVMTLHPGVYRSHHGPTVSEFGPDTGSDIPVAAEFTRALRPLLDHFGTHPNFHLVLFTLDETVFSRELAPLAGFYPAVYLGAPWWFLDAPDAVRRFRAATIETAGYTRSAGFVDDTRALLSVPVRHDMSRRIDAGVLAGLVAEHRLDEDEAHEIAIDLVAGRPRVAFKL
jgi:glucuronate isomerase